ncbi:MAG: hypothetical protein J6A88_05090 [Oscillospiraceae bacterium]|nr:hypothetical protein [Oscillospiraceae bacterium]
MLIVYLIFIPVSISFIRDIIQSVKGKNIKNLFPSVLLIPFCFCFLIGIISGGSALNNAQTDYELYQAGHYYLESHGNWTEVSYDRYMFVFISEIIGFASLAVAFVVGIIKNRKPNANCL